MAGLAMVLASMLAACGKPAAQHQNKQQAAKPALAVNVVHLVQRVWPRIATASGAVQPWQEASVGAEVNGLKLAEVLVNVGDVVKQGQLLARLSDETVRADVAAQRATLVEAEASAAQAAGEARRAHELDKSGAISQQDLIQYDTQAKTAAAKLAAARAQFDSQQLRLRYTRVVAPDDGVISARSATVGAVVSSGTELFKLIRKNRLEWRAEMHGEVLPRINPGRPCGCAAWMAVWSRGVCARLRPRWMPARAMASSTSTCPRRPRRLASRLACTCRATCCWATRRLRRCRSRPCSRATATTT